MEPSAQIEAIVKMARRRHLAWLFRCLVALLFVLLALGLYMQQPLYFMALALVAVIAYSAHQTART